MNNKLGNEMKNKLIEKKINAESVEHQRLKEECERLQVDKQLTEQKLLKFSQLENKLMDDFKNFRRDEDQQQSSILNLKADLTRLDFKLSEQKLAIDNTKKNISFLKQMYVELDDTNHCLMGDDNDRFIGSDWYLPKIKSRCFDDLIEAMAWDETQINNWRTIYINHQSYHENMAGSLFQNTTGLWQFYAVDGFALGSPRKTLLNLVKSRIELLNSIVITKQQNNHLLQEVETINNALFNLYKKLAITKSDVKCTEENLDKTQLSIKKQRCQLEILTKNKIGLQRLMTLSSTNLLLLDLEFSHQNFKNLLAQAPDIIDDNCVELNYNKIVNYQKHLDIFCMDLEVKLKKINLDEVNLKFSAGEFKEFISTKEYKQLSDRLIRANELILEKKKLKEHYEKLHHTYFSAHKINVDREAEIESKRLETINIEQLKQPLDVAKYLGDHESTGYLRDYLTQRNDKYWFSDCISYFISFLFNYPFGYVTDKQRRTEFVNNQLRPALSSYQNSGSNVELERVLCTASSSFFKPRTRDNASYCLTLESMLEELRKGLLTNDQLDKTPELEEESSNYFMCGCFS